MDDEGNEHLPKQERMRQRWTASLDKIFADLVVEQILLGNRPNNIFDKKAWNYIREEFNRQTNLNFNNNQLRKHLDVLRTRFFSLKSALDQQDLMEEPCYLGFDLWEEFGAQQKPPETTRVKDCPIFDQLCAIFGDSGAEGKYARSSHYNEGLEKSAGGETSCPEIVNLHPEKPSSATPVQGNVSLPENPNKSITERKRKRAPEVRNGRSEETNMAETLGETMAEALCEMIAASKLRANATSKNDAKYTITNCIRALDEVEGIDDWLYYAALDLFEDPVLREMFLSLKSNSMRLAWLQGKYAQFFS
ncbi:OLC1v1018205C1 [Oldenlandia corymbosa var. corymbosa]|uniref:OLC1v1018205C1 n=1 Tax=Oldenlandia corymbosa var. corymbosa TaxID=529605 RepID=A0AAV1EB36_OLDCO|nr:OLC1v1018205C1 [Oldenlandia corymbosa var. corymbosa]